MKQIEKGHDAMKSFADRSYPFVSLMRVRAIHTVLWPVLLLFALVGRANPASGQCGYEWQEGFNLPGADGPVYASVVFDDGSGPALYIGGGFEHVDKVPARGLARWDGRAWQEVGDGLGDAGVTVRALLVQNDAGGHRLIVGGSFTRAGASYAQNIAQWDGQAWSTFGTGVSGSVQAMTFFDGGLGVELVVGGRSYSAFIAKWDGTTWTSLGSGVWDQYQYYEAQVQALEVFDEDGNGPLTPKLFVGGKFSHAGGTVSANLARWNGDTWSKVTTDSAAVLPGGVTGPVMALKVFDPDLNGPQSARLMVAGNFTGPHGNQPSPNLVGWTGSEWVSIGAQGLDSTDFVSSMTTRLTLDGSQLLIAGRFTSVAGTAARNMAEWDVANWMPLDGAIDHKHPEALTITSIDEPRLGESFVFAGGDFTSAGDVIAGHIAAWQRTTWKTMGQGAGLGGEFVMSLAVFEHDEAETMFAGLAGSDGVAVARLEGAQWLNSDENLEGFTAGLFVDLKDDHGQSRLFAAGYFALLAEDKQAAVLEWTGTKWTILGHGLTGNGERFAVFDDGRGAGACLHVAGAMQLQGKYASIVRWDGVAWQALPDFPLGSPGAMEVFDDGSGPALFVGGLTSYGGLSKWDGHQWSNVEGAPSIPAEFTQDGSGWVSALEVFDDGHGPALYVGGRFTHAGDVAAGGIAKWDGRSWTSPQGGVKAAGQTVPYVWTMTTINDGQGDSLLVIGSFIQAGQVPAQKIAKWNGDQWTAPHLAIANSDSLWCVLSMPEEGSDADSLWIGGSFDTDASSSSHNIAKWAPADLPPQIVQQPADRTRPPGGTTAFDVTIESGAATYQWRHDSSPMIDDDRISGSNTTTLTIMDLQESDAGQYDVVIANDCGEAITSPATLLVGAQCSGDITGINGQVDMADFQLVFANWGSCSGCPADTDGNGVVNMDDLLTVISQWGPCP